MKRKTDNFSKFINPEKKGAALKEEIRQEKKAAKKERKQAIERHFEEKRRARQQQQEQDFQPQPRGFRKGPGAPIKLDKATQNGKTAPAGSGSAAGSNASAITGNMPLNKYIAHSGLCSRRDAADLIRQDKVEVNGQIVNEPGTKVTANDIVKVNGKKITISRNFVYILLNKPKDYITTTDDPQGRKTVLDLIRNATAERVYPVGRLDRNTSGVLLLTNDGDLSQKLAHPKHEIKKIYHVSLDKPLTKADFDKIIAGGIVLEDGPAIVDVIAYADSRDKTQIGLEIHSGRNRIVRRIFEHLGYDVRGLDRVTYAGLTKKNVQRGKWRLLTEKEIRILKYLNSSFKGSPEKTGSKNAQRAQALQASFNIDSDDTIDLDEPPIQNLKSAPRKDEITEEDLAFAERKGYGGRKPATGKNAKPAAFRGKKSDSTSPSERSSFRKPDPSGKKSAYGKPVTGVKRVGKSRPTGDLETGSDKPKRSFDKPERSFGKSDRGTGKPERNFGKPERSFGKSDRSSGKPERSLGKSDRAVGKSDRSTGKPERSFGKSERSSGKSERNFGKPDRKFGKPERSFGKPDRSSGKPDRSSGKSERPGARSKSSYPSKGRKSR